MNASDLLILFIWISFRLISRIVRMLYDVTHTIHIFICILINLNDKTWCIKLYHLNRQYPSDFTISQRFFIALCIKIFLKIHLLFQIRTKFFWECVYTTYTTSQYKNPINFKDETKNEKLFMLFFVGNNKRPKKNLSQQFIKKGD